MAKTPYIVIAHLADGPAVTDHPSKAAAHRACKALRAAGVDAFAYSVADAQRFGLDPRG